MSGSSSVSLVGTPEPRKPRFAVVGAGAVGGYFGALLTRAGFPTVLIGRPAWVATVAREGLELLGPGREKREAIVPTGQAEARTPSRHSGREESRSFRTVVRPEVSESLSAVATADYVLVCVKSMDTEDVARALASLLSPGAVVVSLQNGVENADLLRRYTACQVLPAVVYLAAQVARPGVVQHFGRGDLVVGPDEAAARGLARCFAEAGVPCVVTERIVEAQWRKFLCNVGLNAVSALGRVTYGEIGANEETWSVVRAVVGEAYAVARALGVTPEECETAAQAEAQVRHLTQQIAGAYSSMAQDLGRGRRTEIEALNGYITRMGKVVQVATPANQMLWALMRTAERRGGP